MAKLGRRPQKQTIARELGVSPAAFSRYVKRGCPTDSVEAAKAWQRRNVDPTQRALRGGQYVPRRQDERRAPAERYRGNTAWLERAFLDGALLGRRAALDWLVSNQAVAAAALIRHAGLPSVEACNAAALCAQALHAVGRVALEVEDEALNELVGADAYDFMDYVRRLDAAQSPEAVAANAEHLAAELWPAEAVRD
jgi:hypothetical protein